MLLMAKPDPAVDNKPRAPIDTVGHSAGGAHGIKNPLHTNKRASYSLSRDVRLSKTPFGSVAMSLSSRSLFKGQRKTPSVTSCYRTWPNERHGRPDTTN